MASERSKRVQKLLGEDSELALAIPPRSRLYPLEPIGIGTFLVERLSGYLIRLAKEHAVNPGALIRELKGPRAAKRNPGDDLNLNYFGYGMNGMSAGTSNWVQIVQTATTRSDLYCLTLLPFRHVLARPGFVTKRRWCPICYEEWRVNSQTIYEPLIWTLRSVRDCPAHQLGLKSICPKCGRALPLLGFFSEAGYCDHCLSWLGTSHSGGAPTSLSQDEQLHLGQLQDLLRIIPNLDPTEAALSLRRNLSIYVERAANGRSNALAKHLQVMPLILTLGKLSPRTVVTLDSILKISLRLNIRVSSLFSSAPIDRDIIAAKEALDSSRCNAVRSKPSKSEIVETLRSALEQSKGDTPKGIARQLGFKSSKALYRADRELCYRIAARNLISGERRKRRRGLDISERCHIEEALKQAISSNQTVTLAEIGEMAGYTSDGPIRRQFPVLSSALVEKNALAARQSRDNIHKTLEKALHENPAPCLEGLLRRLGYSSTLRETESELCNQISARYREQTERYAESIRRQALAMLNEDPVPSARQAIKRLGVRWAYMRRLFPTILRMFSVQHQNCVAARIERLHQERIGDVRRIVADLKCSGLYPSRRLVAQLLPPGPHLGLAEFTAAWRDAKRLAAS
jgi:TniQ